MKLRTLQCGSCTAPLEVLAHEIQAGCEYCGTQTRVDHSEPEPDRRPAPLQELDDQWIRQREMLMRATKDGALAVPSVVGSVVVGLVFLAFGAIWTVGAASVGAPAFFPLFGVLWMVLVGVGMAGALRRARRFASAKDEYRRQRRTLLND